MTATAKLNQLQVGDALPGRTYTCGNVQLMLYNASLWNGHRIHFDHPYATEVEGYPGLVIAGPLIGDWLTQCLMEWLDDTGQLKRLNYSNRASAYVGDLVTSGGRITAVDKTTGEVEIELFVVNEKNDNLAPGSASVLLPVADTS